MSEITYKVWDKLKKRYDLGLIIDQDGRIFRFAGSNCEYVDAERYELNLDCDPSKLKSISGLVPKKVNYRHSIDNMNAQLDRHDEMILIIYGSETESGRVVSTKNGKVMFKVGRNGGKLKLADYINKKNGFN